MKITDQVGTQLVEGSDLSLMPPVPIALLARRLGVGCIEKRDMIEEGRLERRGTDIRIYVRSDLSRARARFTVAHELAHLVLASDDGPLVARRDRLSMDEEERLCDSIAAGILLPAPWVRQRFLDRQQNLSTVRHLAHLAEVSMAAATVRLAELCGWRLSLLRWKRDNQRWAYRSGAAVPTRLHGEIGSTAATGPVLDEIGRRTRRDVRARLPIAVAQQRIEPSSQVSVSTTTALVLVDLQQVRSAGS